jgi:hypothetical protein
MLETLAISDLPGELLLEVDALLLSRELGGPLSGTLNLFINRVG